LRIINPNVFRRFLGQLMTKISDSRLICKQKSIILFQTMLFFATDIYWFIRHYLEIELFPSIITNIGFVRKWRVLHMYSCFTSIINSIDLARM
jgi:hypothetical protein